MKTSKKTLVLVSVIITVAAILIIAGLVTILKVLEDINPYLHVAVVGLLLFALVFGFIYSHITDVVRRHEEGEDDDDDNDDDDIVNNVTNMASMTSTVSADDYDIKNVAAEDKEVIDEFLDLDERIKKTEKTISDSFGDDKEIDIADLALLNLQIQAMKRYFNLLATRMELKSIIRYNK